VVRNAGQRQGGSCEQTAYVMVAMVASIALIALAASCSSGSSGSSGSSESAASRATNLHGKILFIREGGKYDEVTVFTAAANGTHERRLSDFGEGPRFSPDGTEVMMAGPTPEGQRILGTLEHYLAPH
jgi:hypothetical protein